MNIFWLCNAPLPKISKAMGVTEACGGGWVEGCADRLLNIKAIRLTVCFPLMGTDGTVKGRAGELNYFAFPKKHTDPTRREPELIGQLKAFLSEIKPDAVHIWGTEYCHTLAMMEACEELGIIDKTIISIQGLCAPCAVHYTAALPWKIINGFSLRDVLRLDNVRLQKNKFEIRGLIETQSIKKAAHIIGRTDFDRAWTHQINPRAKYHFCNEILRNSFYSNDKWSLSECERHSIFISQSMYPIKGFHLALEALYIISRQFPNTRLYVAGADITDKSTLTKRLKRTRYAQYIDEIITRKKLKDRVVFLGILDETQMRRRFLKSHVFVSPSSIENSPNSVGEAMLLGVPVISSDVGGVKNLALHDREALLYQYDAPYMLAYHISKIFSDDSLALRLSEAAALKASSTHDPHVNTDRLIDIYNCVTGG